MNQFDNTPVMSAEEPAGPAGWLKVWVQAFSQPSEQSFLQIISSPHANSKTAFIWAFIAGTLAGIVQAFVQTITLALGTASPLSSIPGLEQYIPSGGTSGDVGSAAITLFTGLCGAPLAGLVGVLFFALGVAIVQWIAKLFGGTGNFEKLAYGFAAIAVPVTVISMGLTLFSVIPYVGLCGSIFSVGLSFYSIYLQVIATKAVNQLSWGQAFGSVLIPGFVVFIFCCCALVAVAMVTGAFTQFAP